MRSLSQQKIKFAVREGHFLNEVKIYQNIIAFFLILKFLTPHSVIYHRNTILNLAEYYEYKCGLSSCSIYQLFHLRSVDKERERISRAKLQIPDSFFSFFFSGAIFRRSNETSSTVSKIIKRMRKSSLCFGAPSSEFWEYLPPMQRIGYIFGVKNIHLQFIICAEY